MKLKIALTTAVACLAVASSANAAPIKYTYSSTFTGTLNGNAFTNVDATFTGIGDTNGYQAVNGFPLNPLTSFSAVAGGTTYVISTPFDFGYNSDGGVAGFVDSTLTTGFTFQSTGLVGYMGGAAASTGTVPFRTGTNFNTDQGAITLTAQGPGTFSAQLITGGTGAVPEPATWAMMVLGFGMVGFGLRYRRKTQTVRVSVA